MSATVNKVPCHVGIIMDGNGRWATNRGLKRAKGHEAGAKNIEPIVDELFACGVKVVSLYAFSYENFSRDEEEVCELMSLLKRGIKKYGDYSLKKGIKLTVSGELSLLDEDLRTEILKQIEKTRSYTGGTLNICIAYGGRQEVCRAFDLIRRDGLIDITPDVVERYLYTDGLAPLDFVIRTGGEYRLSNFLLWQAAYAELYFTSVLWPDFTCEEVRRALDDYKIRVRRFGKN